LHPELLIAVVGPWDERDSEGYWRCRAGCGLVFKAKATRNLHEKKKHDGLVAPDVPPPPTESESHKADYLFNCHSAKLTFGLVLGDINDAIREGDGDRLMDLYKMALPIYYSHGRTKYQSIQLYFFWSRQRLCCPRFKPSG